MKSEKRNKRMNNKGFSLVELIVVMAIMAILAVTLAPKLMHYVDKARVASDQEAVSTVYNAARLALADETISDAFDTNAVHINNASSTHTYDVVNLDTLYDIDADGSFTLDSTVADDNAFYQEIANVVGNFKLKSNNADADTDIVIVKNVVTNTLSVQLRYNGVANPPTFANISAAIAAPDYEVTE